MLGFGSRFRATRSTEEWIAELRDGEQQPEGTKESGRDKSPTTRVKG